MTAAVLTLTVILSATALGAFLVGVAADAAERRQERREARRALLRYRANQRREAWSAAYAATVLRVPSERL